MAVSFIDGGNRSTQRKPVASHWQTTSHNVVHNEYTSPWTLLYGILLKPYYILVLLTILIYIFYLTYAMAAGSLLRLHQPSIVTACMLVLSNRMVWWWSRFSYISPITLILWCPLPHTKEHLLNISKRWQYKNIFIYMALKTNMAQFTSNKSDCIDSLIISTFKYKCSL